MSSPPVGAYWITAYPSENPIRSVILLNYTFFFFFSGGGKDKTQRGAPWQRRGGGGDIEMFSSALPGLGLKDG